MLFGSQVLAPLAHGPLGRYGPDAGRSAGLGSGESASTCFVLTSHVQMTYLYHGQRG
jgi:hypothetical protein